MPVFFCRPQKCSNSMLISNFVFSQENIKKDLDRKFRNRKICMKIVCKILTDEQKHFVFFFFFWMKWLLEGKLGVFSMTQKQNIRVCSRNPKVHQYKKKCECHDHRSKPCLFVSVISRALFIFNLLIKGKRNQHYYLDVN